MDYLKELAYVKLLVKFMIPTPPLDKTIFLTECVMNGISEDDLVQNKYVDTEWITRDGLYKIEISADDYGGFEFWARDRKTGKLISGKDPLWQLFHPICKLNENSALWDDEEERMMDRSELRKDPKYTADYSGNSYFLVPTRKDDDYLLW